MDQPADQVRVKYIRVRNEGAHAFTDRYDGVPICIEPGDSENFPLDMAEHIFGVRADGSATRDQMLRHVTRRQGWNTPRHLEKDKDSGKTAAETLFDQLKIEPVTYKLVEEKKPDTSKPIPADPQVPDNKALYAARRDKLTQGAGRGA